MLCICAAEARVQMSAMRCAGLAELVLNAQVVEQMSAMYIALPKLLLNQAAPVAILQRKTAAVVHFSQIRLSVTHWGRAAFAIWHLSVL